MAGINAALSGGEAFHIREREKAQLDDVYWWLFEGITNETVSLHNWTLPKIMYVLLIKVDILYRIFCNW